MSGRVVESPLLDEEPKVYGALRLFSLIELAIPDSTVERAREAFASAVAFVLSALVVARVALLLVNVVAVLLLVVLLAFVVLLLRLVELVV